MRAGKELLAANRDAMDEIAAYLIQKRDDHRKRIYGDFSSGDCKTEWKRGRSG